MYLNGKLLIGKNEKKETVIFPNMANRHGIITGASGTGKTTTVKVLAESFSSAGVPVFVADVKGDLGGCAYSGESNENLVHIGIVTTMALVLHNIIEGMAVYSTALSDSSLALALSIGVGFHNIPLGMVIMSSFYQSTNDKKKAALSIGLVSISTFVGGLIMYLFKLTSVNEVVLGIMLSITLGMLVYIVVDELLPRIIHSKGRETSIWGATAGIILVVLSVFFGG